MKSLSIAATGMLAQQRNVEVISNNLANLNTVGFKRQRAEFQDLLYQTIERAGASTSSTGTIAPNGVQIGAGVKTGSVYRITEQGSLTTTGNDLDLAISGRGYFHVLLPDGTEAYTRAGNFSVSADGQMVTEDGYQVLPGITIPSNATDISISKDGQVEVAVPGQAQPSTVGQLELATFFNEAGLEAIGDNLLLESAASGQPTIGQPNVDGIGSVEQGFVETSNVDAVQEITSLIAAQRAYEMNSKVIETSDQMLSTGSNLR